MALPSSWSEPRKRRARSEERFKREARVTAALKSPHTIELCDFGVSQAGQYYYGMELLEGWDLERFIRRFGPRPPARVVFWLKQMCHSLREAHAAGLVHRDIKPANLIVCRYRHPGRPSRQGNVPSAASFSKAALPTHCD